MDAYSSIEKDDSTKAVLNKYDDEVDGDKLEYDPDDACQIISRRPLLPVSYYLRGHVATYLNNYELRLYIVITMNHSIALKSYIYPNQGY